MGIRHALLFCLMLTVFAFIPDLRAQTMTQPALDSRQQAMVPVAAFTATGEIERLTDALNAGLDAGLTVNEMKEIIVQLYAYAGFPRSLNGLATLMDVVEKRKRAGIHDSEGVLPNPLPGDKSALEIGTENQTTLAGAPVTGPLFEFAPAIDHFLKAHLFGDIFGRDNLTFQDREIVTIAALAHMRGVNSQLQSHFNIGMNVGLTASQLDNLVSVLRTTVSEPTADNAHQILQTVIRSRTP